MANVGSPPDNISAYDDETSSTNPATADAAVPGHVGHGEAEASYTVSSSVLHMQARVFGSGNVSLTGGATGYGSAQFSADQTFDSDTWVRVTGTFTRNDTEPSGSISTNLFVGGYSWTQEFGINGTYSFDDFVPISGIRNINVTVIETEPHTTLGAGSGESTYDVTITIFNNGSGASQGDAILPTALGGSARSTSIPSPATAAGSTRRWPTASSVRG